jgi:hypothetical protein
MTPERPIENDSDAELGRNTYAELGQQPESAEVEAVFDAHGFVDAARTRIKEEDLDTRRNNAAYGEGLRPIKDEANVIIRQKTSVLPEDYRYYHGVLSTFMWGVARFEGATDFRKLAQDQRTAIIQALADDFIEMIQYVRSLGGTKSLMEYLAFYRYGPEDIKKLREKYPNVSNKDFKGAFIKKKLDPEAYLETL